MEDILYCFRINEDTGEINQITVEKFTKSRDAYIWKLPSGYTKYTYKRNIDKVCHGEYCTFNPNFTKALENILHDLEYRRNEARQKHDKYYGIIKKIHFQYLDSTPINLDVL